MGADLQAQSVFDPNDPIVTYNPSAPPTVPTNNLPAKWVRTSRLSRSWNTNSFKSYIYRGIAFRLKFPKNYDASGNTKYPLFLFFHGLGEKGSVYDNEYQLYHGGQHHMNAVDNGKFNGFLLYPQSSRDDGNFTDQTRAYVAEVIERFLIPEVNVDPFRVSVNGLSLGGYNTWQFFLNHPKLIAAALPISSASTTYNTSVVTHKFTPIWLFQGALDANPAPSFARTINDRAIAAGGNFTYKEYPNEGHGCWNTAWNERDYFPFLTRANKANPWPLYGRTEFCEFGGSFSTTIGVEAGFDQYEWRKDGNLLTGANTASNTLTVTSIGTYSCRIRKGTTWSAWSPIPVVIKYKTSTIPPDITVSGLGSRVLPSPDGKTTVDLEVPSNFLSYIWKRVGETPTLSTTNVLQGATVGSYTVQATEQFACASTNSAPFAVINANGPNKPSTPSNLLAIPMSYTSLKLAWTGSAGTGASAPTNFEIYQATQPAGPYKFAAIVAGNVFSMVREGLTPGAKYYFVVRAVNNTAGSGISNEASATTLKDAEPPTAPGGLRETGSTRNSLSLAWNESIDNVAVSQYEIFINGVKSYVTATNEYVLHNLEYGKKYNVTVRAVDVAGNNSAFSNQLTTQPRNNGLTYKHYVGTGTWNALPNFGLLTPVATGTMPNVSIADRSQDENYAYMWQGYIRIPNITGDYYFRTTSADGSRLYLSEYDYNATPTVDNDGVHGTQNRNSQAIRLQAGSVLPITITYFQKNTGNSMSIRWRLPNTGSSEYVVIPDSAFVEAPLPVTGSAPAKPTNLTANAISYKQVNLAWNDNSNNESKFEVFRSTDSLSGFATIAVLPTNATGFSDTLVEGNTKYFYRVRAANQHGESAFDKAGPGVNYSYYELSGITAVPDFRILNPVTSGIISNFALGVQQRTNNFAIKYESVINIPTAGDYTFYIRSDDGSRMYIDDVLLINNDAVQGSVERNASRSLSAGPHKISIGYFKATSGEALTVSYARSGTGGFSKRAIPDSDLGEALVSATTLAAPPVPQVPTAINAKGITSSSIRVNWTSNPTNATAVELYRSFNDNSTYVLLATLPPTTTVFLDTALYPSSLFYYKARTVGEGGASEYSEEKSARSLGVIPTIVPIEDVYMRFNSQKTVPVEAIAGSPTSISLSISNLPAFAQFDSVANGKGVITFNPNNSHQGEYNITVVARNPQNNTYTSQFKLTVNSNYVPAITAIGSQSVNEKQVKQVNVTATDGDSGDELSWSLGSNTPSFVTITGNNRSASVSLAPGYSDAGTYRVLVVANDGKNGKDTTSFNLTVVNVPTTGDDGSAPTKVRDLAGTFVNSLNAVRLTWNNTAYNALRNEIHRSTSMSGPYTILNPGATNKDSIGYTDNSSLGNTTYYYIVRTVNNNGSENSSTVQVRTSNRMPVIGGDDRYFAKSSTVTNITLSATDDPGETVVLSVSGLPEFATFTPGANGTGVLRVAATSSHIGLYNFQLTATDGAGAKTVKSLKLSITNKFVTSTYININKSIYPVGEPWNSVNAEASVLAGTVMANLKNESKESTGMNFVFIETSSPYEIGPIAGSDNGVFPDNVMKTGIQTGQEVRNFEIVFPGGAPASKRYNVLFYSNRGGSASQLVDFKIGDQTVTLEMLRNVDKVARINGITPVNNKIAIQMLKNGSANATLNAVIIEEYDAATGGVFPPTGLSVLGSTKNSINLKWANSSSGVTGYEIWRSTTENGTYAKLPGTVAATTFTYNDGGLNEGSTYYYKIRSVLATGFSDFSDVLKASTINYSIKVNFNDGSTASPAEPEPWNNINALVMNGYRLSNLIDDKKQPTGLNLSILNNFSGFNTWGLVTGNNSGVVPDNVMKGFYYVQFGETARMKVDGLNLNTTYNFVFYGNCDTRAGGSLVGVYTIGDKSVTLDAKNNTSKVIQISDVHPNADGSVTIEVRALAAGYGFVNSIEIQELPSDPDSQGSGRSKANAKSGNGNTLSLSGADDSNSSENKFSVSAYPNPFVDQFSLKVKSAKVENNALILVRNMAGAIVYSKKAFNLPAGVSSVDVSLGQSKLSPGIYLVQIMQQNTGAVIGSVKLVRQ